MPKKPAFWAAIGADAITVRDLTPRLPSASTVTLRGKAPDPAEEDRAIKTRGSVETYSLAAETTNIAYLPDVISRVASDDRKRISVPRTCCRIHLSNTKATALPGSIYPRPSGWSDAPGLTRSPPRIRWHDHRRRIRHRQGPGPRKDLREYDLHRFDRPSLSKCFGLNLLSSVEVD